MGNIDQGYNVDVLSLSDVTLITSGVINPSLVGFEAPMGSLFLQQNGTSSAIFLKIGTLDTNWRQLTGLPTGGTTGQVLTKNSSTDFDVSFLTPTVTNAVYAEDLTVFVRNDSGGPLLKGTPVYQMGNVGESWTISVGAADAANPLKMPAIGVLAQDLANTITGNCLILGSIHDVPTAAFAAGDPVYVAPGGGYTNVKPTASNVAIQFLGFVTKVHATNGGGVITGTGTVDQFAANNGSGFRGWDGSAWVPLLSSLSQSDIITALGYTPYNATNPSGYISSNQNITLSGDVTGSGTTSIATTLSNTGVAAGTYNNTAVSNTPLTFDTKGRLTAKGTEVTITPLVGSLQQSGATTGQVIQWNGTTWTPGTVAGDTINGAVKQCLTGSIGTLSGTSIIPGDNTAPLISEGTQLMTQSITPSTLASKVCASFSMLIDVANNDKDFNVALFRNTTCVCSSTNNVRTSGKQQNFSFSFVDSPATTSAVTYSLRVGTATSTTWYVNITSGVNFGGTLNSSWTLMEIV